MKECKAPGVYGLACRQSEDCLLLKQARDEAESASLDDPKWMAYENQNFPNLGKKYGCPSVAVREMEELVEKHLDKKKSE